MIFVGCFPRWHLSEVIHKLEHLYTYLSTFSRPYTPAIKILTGTKKAETLLLLAQIAGIISEVGEIRISHIPRGFALDDVIEFIILDSFGMEQRGLFMATNRDFSRSSLLAEQYQREMELITVALEEESQEEQEERVGLVERSWSLTCACFHSQLESSDQPAYTPVAYARP